MLSPKKSYDPADMLATLKPICDKIDCIAFSTEPKQTMECKMRGQAK